MPTLRSAGQSPRLLLTEAPRVIQPRAGVTYSEAYRARQGTWGARWVGTRHRGQGRPFSPNGAKGTAEPQLQPTGVSRDPEPRGTSCSDLDFKVKVVTAIQSNFNFLSFFFNLWLK